MTTDASFFPRDRGAIARFALLAAGLALYLLLCRDALIDDALITRSYGRSLMTSALVSLVTRNRVAAVFVPTWLEFLAMALCIRGIGRALALP